MTVLRLAIHVGQSFRQAGRQVEDGARSRKLGRARECQRFALASGKLDVLEVGIFEVGGIFQAEAEEAVEADVSDPDQG